MFRLLMSVILLLTFGRTIAFGDNADSQKLYDAKCSKCHGKDGTGSEKLAKILKVDNTKLDLTSDSVANAKDSELIKITTNGQKKMPVFKDKLKTEEIEALVKYIRGFGTSKK